jgi:hypothetical protein
VNWEGDGERERYWHTANARRPSLTVRRCQNSICIMRISSSNGSKAMLAGDWYECMPMSRGSSVRQARSGCARALEAWQIEFRRQTCSSTQDSMFSMVSMFQLVRRCSGVLARYADALLAAARIGQCPLWS